MKTGAKQGWRRIAGLALAALMTPAFCAMAQEAQAPASEEAAVQSHEVSNAEVIQITFKSDENDILTQQAVAKLDEVVESLVFSNADLGNVIRLIGERLDMNFIFDADDIHGNVTMRLNNVRLRDALDSILSTRELAMIVDPSGIFRIVPQEQVGKTSIETKTEVIQLNWVSAVDTKETIAAFVSDDVGKIESNEESNLLIVTDVPPNIEIIKGLIAHIDKPERQVEIEARLVDINIGALRDLGTEWTVAKDNEASDWYLPSELKDDLNELGWDSDDLTVDYTDALGVVNNMTEGIGFNSTSAGTLALGESIGIFGDMYNFNAVFTALESRGIVEVLASPRVTTLNNVPASIEIIENIPYTEAQQSTSSDDSAVTVEFEQAGVRIQVKPIITPNGFVNMNVNLEQAIYRERVGLDSNGTSALAPPRIDERNAETNVIVGTGETVALGGLRQVRSVEDITGVPFLHQIPIIGWLFKTKSNDQDRTELVLMITPNILETSIAMRDRDQELYDRIDTKWHLPDYFMDDVSNVEDEAHENLDRTVR